MINELCLCICRSLLRGWYLSRWIGHRSREPFPLHHLHIFKPRALVPRFLFWRGPVTIELIDMAPPLSPEQLADTARNLWVLSSSLFTVIDNPFQGWPPRCSHWLHVVGFSHNFVRMKTTNLSESDAILRYRHHIWARGWANLDEKVFNDYSFMGSGALIFSFSNFLDVSKTEILAQESVSLSVGLHCDNSLWVD